MTDITPSMLRTLAFFISMIVCIASASCPGGHGRRTAIARVVDSGWHITRVTEDPSFRLHRSSIADTNTSITCGAGDWRRVWALGVPHAIGSSESR